jgi:hypothetical protein
MEPPKPQPAIAAPAEPEQDKEPDDAERAFYSRQIDDLADEYSRLH